MESPLRPILQKAYIGIGEVCIGSSLVAATNEISKPSFVGLGGVVLGAVIGADGIRRSIGAVEEAYEQGNTDHQ